MPNPDVIESVNTITRCLLENNITFSFRVYDIDNVRRVEFFSKDAQNCMRLLPQQFKIGYDNRKTAIAKCII